MMADKYDAVAAVELALSGKPMDFNDMVKVGLADRVINAVDAKRQEIASTMFGPAPEAAEETSELDDESINTDTEESEASEDGENASGDND